MTDKIRVKDLSSELGVTNRELMQTLRDLGIQAKSHMSALTEEEALEARRRISDQPASTEVIRKEVQPGMIVRRRRKRAPEEKKPAPEPEEEAAPEAGAPKEAPAEAVASEHAEAEPAEAEPVEETAAEVPAREVEKAPEEPLQAEPAEAGEDAEASEAAPEEEPAGAEPEEPKRKEKKAKKPKPKVEAGPQVKVISKPKAPPKAETEPVAIEPAAPKEPATPPPQEAEAKKKKKKKDKRVVEFSPHLVDEEERRAANLHAKKKRRADMKTASKAKKGKRRGPAEMEARPAAAQPAKAAKRKIKVDEAIRVADLAKQMGVKAQALIKVLFDLGVMTTINQSIDIDTATLAAGEFGYEVEKVGFSEEEFLSPAVDTEAEEPEKLKPRAPVVTIMGHVDHGKTSLLDAIRESDVISGEAGGITQHIGAYDVTTPRGKVVFLDTPGHEAFTAMRARGAQVTDLVILVVAADDGVMDQTREAINHSKAAGVPILVAVNKIDKDEANPDRVKRELADHGLVPEDWGGDTIFSEVSAKKHIGLEELLELVLLQAEVLELKANPDKRAVGRIVEARLDIGRGPVATVLIQGGTLRQGDAFVCGVHHGKVRAMFDDQGKKVKEAGPATPVEVQGFDSVPEAGDEFVCVEDDKVARRIAQTRLAKVRERQLAKENKVTLESFMAQRVGQEVKTLNLVLKADVQGSLEAVQEALNKLSTDEVKVDVVHSGAGAITESDIMLASASEAIIIGFNVRPTAKIKEVADQENVEIRFYDIIYKLVGDIKDAMAGMLEPVISEKYLGQAEVRDTFNVPKVGTVAGCYVEDGVLQRNAEVRLLRDGVVIYTGKLSSLKRYKEDAKEVAKGYECGAGLERFNDIKVGDVIEAFTKVEERPTL
jgi:translation initiation factor IF-2